ncbi:ABC transporter ATP-binding protein [Bacillus paralicheniformis]|uniref:ABC transporter ATP-binding protein n=1 Tax=Bacillus paralicheniformis TaxID=1648923 RepID=UPI00232D1BC2|nr:ABC transporter ATP-binding protein [Bacillus paralicheniformis]MED1714998.1 ABC transporter ATP-binding protein [Bacillus paralicheniformis]
MRASVLQTQKLSKSYGEGAHQFFALRNIDLDIKKGEFTAIMGPSGSGKSTLLNMLSGLDKPTSGEVTLDGIHLSHCNEAQITQLRRDNIGFIFQMFHLIPVLTAEENITLPILLAGKKDKSVNKKANDLLQLLGIGRLASSYPSQMSGGQQQRVAIARALIMEPSIVLADEPTGSLDTKAGDAILTILRHFCDTKKQSLIMVTHDANVASHAHRIVFMKDGELAGDIQLTATPKVNLSHITKRLEDVYA